MGGRIDVKANDILELLGELRVGRQLERADAMRCELMGVEDALHRTQAHACRLRQHPAGPVRCIPWRRSKSQINDLLHGGGRKRRFARPAGLVAGEPVDALGYEPRLPPPHHGIDLPDRRMISAVP